MPTTRLFTALAGAVLLSFSACKKGDDNTAGSGGTNPTNPAATGYQIDAFWKGLPSGTTPLALQPDGRIVCVKGDSLKRFGADGSPDNSFRASTAISGQQGYFGPAAFSADGKMYIAYQKATTALGAGIVRLNADGSLDNSFSVTALQKTPSGNFPDINAMVLLPDGDLLVAGEFSYTIGSDYYANVARLKSDGSLNTAFKSPISNLSAVVTAMTRTDDAVVVSGNFNRAFAAGTGYGFIRFNPASGTVDEGFFLKEALWASYANTSIVYTTGATAIIPQSDGKLLITGGFGSIGEDSKGGAASYPGLARLNADGSLDGSFKPADGGVVSLLSNGNIVVGRSSRLIGEQLSAFLGVMDGTGKMASAFGNAGMDKGNAGTIFKISDSELILGGEFTKGTSYYGAIKVRK